MHSYLERLEDNLTQKTEVLTGIFESNKTLIENLDVDNSGLETYDGYLAEQNEYINRLDKLDREYDVIYEYILEHPETVAESDLSYKAKIRVLIASVHEKSHAVAEIEKQSRQLVDMYFNKKRVEINSTRKAARVIQNHYITRPYGAAEDNSIIDTKINA